MTDLNSQQRLAVEHGEGPLLIVAGAGTGKTRTLVHRVAQQIGRGISPERILLLTFTRRAASEMLRRVDQVLPPQDQRTSRAGSIWGGTFHALAARLLRMHGQSIGLSPGFTIHDRSDSEDLMDVVRTELGLPQQDPMFPKKGSCMAIYSQAINSQSPLKTVLAESYPGQVNYEDGLRQLFTTYVDHKHTAGILDYDDLLLYWQILLQDSEAGEAIRSRFDAVLVDEYQDTNLLQADILKLLRPTGQGLTVVGDDAQSIYSFRGANVRNILDFPDQFPETRIIKLEENYRSTLPILAATNAVLADMSEQHAKRLWSSRASGAQPALVSCVDENEEAQYVVRQVLAHRDEGIDLQRQAVLFRASHHSIVLEAELARHNIPFEKHGGLKFLEAAHVKDLLSILRLVENPRDVVAGTRVLKLLPGIGSQRAKQLMDLLLEGGFTAWQDARVPTATLDAWGKLNGLLEQLATVTPQNVAFQIYLAREFYNPYLMQRYDHGEARLQDLEQMEQLASRYCDRCTMLAELTLDPPNSTREVARPGQSDEDVLVLSTIHSAKGLEWDAVYIIHATDGNIPSGRCVNSAKQIDEERRLLYVAMTRAKDWLSVCIPQRAFHGSRRGAQDAYELAQPSRFLTSTLQHMFDCCYSEVSPRPRDAQQSAHRRGVTLARDRARAFWSD